MTIMSSLDSVNAIAVDAYANSNTYLFVLKKAYVMNGNFCSRSVDDYQLAPS